MSGVVGVRINRKHQSRVFSSVFIMPSATLSMPSGQHSPMRRSSGKPFGCLGSVCFSTHHLMAFTTLTKCLFVRLILSASASSTVRSLALMARMKTSTGQEERRSPEWGL